MWFEMKPWLISKTGLSQQIIATSIQVGDDDALLKCLVDLAESCPKFLRPQVETILQLAIKVSWLASELVFFHCIVY